MLTAYMASRWIHASETAAEAAGLTEGPRSTMKQKRNGWLIRFEFYSADFDKIPVFEQHIRDWGFAMHATSGDEQARSYTVVTR